jgi:hypothetical protein
VNRLKWMLVGTIGAGTVATAAIAGFSLMVEARPLAERFLTQLDSGNVTQAYDMLSPSVRATYPARNLSRLGAVRGSKVGPQRSFVRVRATSQSLRMRSVGKPTFSPPTSVVVCFVENPNENFKSVAYTAVTVSGREPASMRIENFQTTSEPVALCR